MGPLFEMRERCMKEIEEEIREKIYKIAKSYENSTDWSFYEKRQAKKNPTVLFGEKSYKCNLFVYEVLLEAGCSIGAPRKTLKVLPFINRPHTARDWFNGEVKLFDFIGENDDGRENCQRGDIITSGTHMGIVGNDETISQSAVEDKIVINDWGFREEEEEEEDFRFYRFNLSKDYYFNI